MLHNVYASLVATHGFSDVALTNPDTQEGNVIFMHLFIDALSLQPCNPTCALSSNYNLLSGETDRWVQLWPLVMPGYRRTRTGTTEHTSASSSKNSLGLDLASTLDQILLTTLTFLWDVS